MLVEYAPCTWNARWPKNVRCHLLDQLKSKQTSRGSPHTQHITVVKTKIPRALNTLTRATCIRNCHSGVTAEILKNPFDCPGALRNYEPDLWPKKHDIASERQIPALDRHLIIFLVQQALVESTLERCWFIVDLLIVEGSLGCFILLFLLSLFVVEVGGVSKLGTERWDRNCLTSDGLGM